MTIGSYEWLRGALAKTTQILEGTTAHRDQLRADNIRLLLENDRLQTQQDKDLLRERDAYREAADRYAASNVELTAALREADEIFHGLTLCGRLTGYIIERMDKWREMFVPSESRLP